MDTLKKAFRILIVEDDKDTSDLVGTIIKDAGFDALFAYDGEHCLAIAEKEVPDLILLDIMLPKMDGLEVCRRLSLSETTRSIPIIMLTAKRELSTKLSSFVAGAKRFITKPFDSHELITEVNRTLNQKDLSDKAINSIDDPMD